MKFTDIKALASVQGPARSVSERLSRRCYSIEDMRKLAAKRLPGSVFDYIEGGGEDEASLRRNLSSFDDWSFLPKWGSVEHQTLGSTLLGGPVAMPLTLSPTGGTRLFHPDGESAVARAALAAGIPYGLAHLSTTTMEAVSAAAPGLRRWFNLEPTADKGLLQAVLDRVSNAGYEALMVNVDCRAIGHRERDYRNGFTAPPSIKPKTVIEGALHPRWALGFLANDAIAFPNLDAEIPEGPLSSTPDMWRTLLAGSYEPTDWDDIRDLRARWNGPIILKGLVNPRDAVLAAEMGIDAIQVSNHGGRQLDHMASPLDVLPEIVDKTAGRMEIIVDGGVRRGSDVIKALALGADACSIGRPYLYGLAAASQAGVTHVLDLLSAEMTRTMMLLGVSTIAELREEGRDLVRHRSEAFTPTHPTETPLAELAFAEMRTP
ncbi:alpha-hydroxy acid oxidase [Arthrobacter sp. 35W]|uniref:alpha-hydroxy acid oxidase n=1 Tax=Arthrobacter sp. 35W TaxID=1132441 RepID=UPI00040C514F|nr:alpha-hydroxy acid oxidase [Arthrobacter sp. 35W]